jgi:hypothetical protein
VNAQALQKAGQKTGVTGPSEMFSYICESILLLLLYPNVKVLATFPFNMEVKKISVKSWCALGSAGTVT